MQSSTSRVSDLLAATMFLRYFDSLAIFGNAQLSRIRYFQSFITLRTFIVKSEIFGNHNLFFLSWSAAICDLLYMLASPSLDWTEPKTLEHQGSQSSVGSGCMPHRAMANILFAKLAKKKL